MAVSPVRCARVSGRRRVPCLAKCFRRSFSDHFFYFSSRPVFRKRPSVRSFSLRGPHAKVLSAARADSFLFSRPSSAQIAATDTHLPDAGARGSGGTSVAAAVAAAAAARPIRARGTAVPAVRPQVLRAPVQQLGPVRTGGRLRDRRRVRVPLPGGRQRAATARPHRPAQERLLGRALEYHRYVVKVVLSAHMLCVYIRFFVFLYPR